MSPAPARLPPALLAAAMAATGAPFPSIAFPVIHALVLFAFLGAPRVAYRRWQVRPPGRPATENDPGAVLLIGAGEDADLFLRALAQDRRQTAQVAGLLALGSRQTGRRIQGYPILGSVDAAGEVLARLQAEGRLPRTLVVTTPDLSGARLAKLVERG